MNFVLAFGGTGARCAEALTYLLAARAVNRPCHVLIVDPDESNGNAKLASDQLQRYQAVHATLGTTPAGRESQPFFAAEVNRGRKNSAFWSFGDKRGQWRDILRREGETEEMAGLLELLYDADDLGMDFGAGYVGRAHIGSLHMLDVLGAKAKEVTASKGEEDRDAMEFFLGELKQATNQAEREQDRPNLIVIGSLFGGTGASGLPAVPPLVKELLNQQLGQVNVGCVQLAPYFSFRGSDQPGDPNSDLHPLATQAAIFHYASADVGYDRFYLVGAPGREETNRDNVRGGERQENKAHYVELAAALAAAHFFEHPPAKGAKGWKPDLLVLGAQQVDWSALPHAAGNGAAHDELRHNMLAFTLFCLLHVDHYAGQLKGGEFRQAAVGQRLHSRGVKDPHVDTLTAFARRYLDWASELGASTEHALLDLTKRRTSGGQADAQQLVTLAPAKNAGKDPYDRVWKRLNKQDNDRQEALGFYVDALTATVDDFAREVYQDRKRGFFWG